MLKDKGYADVVGSKPFIERSFQYGYIVDGTGWMRMLKSKSLTNQTYDKELAEEIIKSIKTEYIHFLKSLQSKLKDDKKSPELNLIGIR